jgi:hypothetical protein
MEIALPLPHTRRLLDGSQTARVLRALARQRALLAVLLALGSFGAIYGFAATLGAGASPLGAGSASVATCQAAGTATGAYTIAYDSMLGGYRVSGITVNNLAAGCAAKAVSVTLTGAANAVLGTIAGVVPAGGGSLALSPGATVAAASITGVSVAISG